MATPFSPFVGRPPKPMLKRRQSELPSDLIDWDAPEIPELDKQRIIYEDHIREILEDHEIEDLLNEQIFAIAHNTVIGEYREMTKKLEQDVTKERSKVNLLLGQIKMFENNVQDNNERIDELESALTDQRNAITSLEQEKENWQGEKRTLQMEIENLTLINEETTLELNNNLEIYLQKKNEVEELKKQLHALKNTVKYYKRKGTEKDMDD